MSVFLAFVAGLIGGALSHKLGGAPSGGPSPRTEQQQPERPETPQQLLQQVEHHVRALRDLGLPWEVGQHSDGHVMVYTTLPGIEGIGRIFQRYGDD